MPVPGRFGAVLTAMVTPFDKQGEVDYAQAGRLARALVDNGSDSIVVSGTTGESPTLTTEEKLRLFRTVKEAIGSRGKVIGGTGNYSTRESIELTHEAPAFVGDRLTITARATEVTDHRCGCEFEVHGPAGVVGRGVFVQRYVQRGRLSAAARKARARGTGGTRDGDQDV